MNKVQRTKNNKTAGFSLIETLVVLFVFAILATVAVQALALTLRGSKKSESVVQSRENVQYAVNVIDRQLRNASSLTCPSPGVASDRINYVDQYGVASSFLCVTSGVDTFIASGSAASRLTSDRVRINNCNAVFTCRVATNVPDSVDISIEAIDANGGNAEGSSVTVSTKVLLRNY